ncbi:MAG TPA: hypothetical protein VFX86_04835 [Candidatus Saccharimonadales bacterium]|nr:hypothetical protein [Candidatus Saccharimonadales bacterium]
MNSENKSVKVWAADNSVKVPQDLKSHLIKSSKDDCNEYAGDGSPNGAVLFAVTKVEDDFAKMTYGCASYLTDMEIVAIKRDGSWSLIQPADYYQTKPNYDGPALPTCSALEKYKINKDLEPECLDSKFEIRQNSNQ